jgi:hypothetical protein
VAAVYFLFLFLCVQWKDTYYYVCTLLLYIEMKGIFVAAVSSVAHNTSIATFEENILHISGCTYTRGFPMC